MLCHGGISAAYLSSGMGARGQRRLHHATGRASFEGQRTARHIRAVAEPWKLEKKRLAATPTGRFLFCATTTNMLGKHGISLAPPATAN
jgi:acyl-coenzyme A thioesterase PaaI-like protein